jgi:hypothetical protein
MDLRSSRPFRVTYSVCFITAAILLLPALSAQERLTIDMLAATRALWPREVTVNIEHQVPLLVNGKVSGSMQAAPGRVYPVRSIEPDGVVVDAMGSSLTFPPADTDILPRAETVRTRLETLAAARTAATPQVKQSPPPTASKAAAAGPTNEIVDRPMESSSFTTEAAWSDSRPQPSKAKSIWPSTSLHLAAGHAENSHHNWWIGTMGTSLDSLSLT